MTQAAVAAPALQPLSTADAARYAAAFAACARGDFIDAQMQAVEIQDRSLVGYLAYDQLMHPTAHKASFDELTGWLGKFRDLPLANRIFGLAVRRKPADAVDPPIPSVAGPVAAGLGPETRGVAAAPLSDRARRARAAFYAGDLKRATTLASAAGDRWIVGLSAYRRQSYDQALTAFRSLSRDEGQDAWVRSAAAFWSARAAGALGQTADAVDELRLAAAAPQTFYGMIAARQLRAQRVADREAGGPARLMLASFVPASGDGAASFVVSDPRAHRAAALAQIGRLSAAAEELRAGLTLARSAAERERWIALALAIGAPLTAAAPALAAAAEDYPTPLLQPKDGFTVDKALVYAIVRQESRFNPEAVSGRGAVGLMQLMPEAAAHAAGDDKLKADMRPLFDPAFNLRVGQDYVTWLMDRAVGYDLLRIVAAYNGGAGMVQRTAQMLGPEAADPFLLLEALPPAETRAYVQKVLAGYWTYKTMFGEETPSLDALAGGAQAADARLDLTEPALTNTNGAATQLSGQLLQPALR
ncbi:lytic transglycosylase domain-containing protein [Phenylobacterium sp. LjRoot225]|uniref:lytic transglycosylase domain-containing protein n=1 Tax=Phenylobacterium sp. LjRoot225 TaxID=3342285 RepID=UPI003ECC3405